MANSTQNKKKPAQTAKKKTTSSAAKSSSAKRNSPPPKQRSTSNKAAPAQDRATVRRQVVSSVMFAAALFLLFVTIVPSGVSQGQTNLWQMLRNFFFGLFGVCAFILPIMMFYTSYVIAKGRAYNNAALSLSGVAAITMCTSSVFHIFSHNAAYLSQTSVGSQLSSAWDAGLSLPNGGAAGAVMGGCIVKMFGKPGGIITVLIIWAALAMLITGTSLPRLFQILTGPFVRASERSRERKEQTALDSENDEPFEEPEVVEKPKKQKRAAPEPKKEYRIPQPEKVLKPNKPSSVIFDDDFSSLPESDAMPDDVEIPTGEKSEQPPVPVFNPFPDGIFISSKPEDTGANASTQPQEEVPAEQPEAEPVSEDKSADDVVDLIDKAAKAAEETPPVQQTIPEEEHKRNYVLPGVECLVESQSGGDADIRDELTATANKLVETLRSFNIETKIVDISRGPSVTRYEIQPAPGIKISRIAGLSDDIAMNLAASGVRIEAPIPNKAAVGVEIPNKKRMSVTLREIIDSPQFKNAKSKLNVALGKDISGNVTCTDLAKMPHLLIAGTTGSGKSVCLNSMIISVLFNSTPDEVKLIMIDPKQVEFTIYNGIPHLMVPVVSDARKAAGALAWAVSEMLKRYKLFSEKGVRDISGYNKLAAKDSEIEPMYQICIFIDELSDLMMVAANEVEDSICRLAQMARAAGMHLVIATQRPSVDVITGIIKANIPSRIALYVSSQVDSRTILDVSGAEKLLGNGDMLFNPVGVSKPVRLQGCFVSDEEVEKVVDFIKTQEECEYDDEVMEEIERQAVLEKKKGSSLPDADSRPDSGADDETMRAIAVVVENQLASTTLLQRKLKIGYAKAARIMDELEEKGIIGPFEGSKPRKVLMSKQQFNEMRALNGDNAFVGVDPSGSEE